MRARTHDMTRLQVMGRPFGTTRAGEQVLQFTLEGSDGFRVELLDYGAIVRSIHVPGRDGDVADVVLGYDRIAGYETDLSYHGAVAGRVAGRIKGGGFTLDGKRYELARNDGANHLHGGVRGFSKVRWDATPTTGGVTFSYHSPDGDEGYPGALDVRVTYSIREPMTLVVEYEATTDKPTPVNLTQHAYFNLAGEGAATVLEHQLAVHGERYAPLGEDFITTGELSPVAGTPFDFRSPSRVGERIEASDPQLRLAGGYDHSFAVEGAPALRPVAELTHAHSGRTLEVLTTEPAVHLYTGNFLDGSREGKHGHRYARHSALCLETQHFADSPNKPQFPSVVLRPGEVLRSRTEFRFTTEPMS